mgnify:FL=1
MGDERQHPDEPADEEEHRVGEDANNDKYKDHARALGGGGEMVISEGPESLIRSLLTVGKGCYIVLPPTNTWLIVTQSR